MSAQIEYDGSLPSPLLQKLHRLSGSGEDELQTLSELRWATSWVNPREPILFEGDLSGATISLLAGMACRYTQVRSGRRQITALLVPGDICGGYGRNVRPTRYSVMALTRAKIAVTDAKAFWQRLEDHPGVAAALTAAATIEENVLRAWVVNLGLRQGKERMAHLLCEVEQRMCACGLLRATGEFELPLTQQELGSALGLTSVHVNRVLQALRADRLIQWRGGVVRINDLDRLRSLADFDPAYLEADAGEARRRHERSTTGAERNFGD